MRLRWVPNSYGKNGEMSHSMIFFLFPFLGSNSCWIALHMHANRISMWHPHVIGNIIKSPKCSRNLKRVATWYSWRVFSWWHGFHLGFEAPSDCDFHGEYVVGGNFSTITNSWPWEFLEGAEHGSWLSSDALLAYLFWDCITKAI